ncbi:hypothetical protein HGRIS_010822 [Hohenbuehelia grisea]|uniref:TAFII28-like protein domain-containing protein n=1 Tax=Hohenbuehelia grisea TaxID=104357 RepID=A0ABR3IXW1_9AGAR
MNSTFSVAPSTPTPGQRGRPPGTGAKRGRKPRGAAAGVGTNTPRPAPVEYAHVHWSLPENGAGSGAGSSTDATVLGPGQQAQVQLASAGTQRSTPGFSSASPRTGSMSLQQSLNAKQQPDTDALASLSQLTPQPINPAHMTSAAGLISFGELGGTDPLNPSSSGAAPTPSAAGVAPLTGILSLSGPNMLPPGGAKGEEEGEGDDELLPAMADDDYSAQLSWQSQSKDNLKVLMDNFSAGQYDRFEAYRRHALPKQGVRKVLQQTLGQQVSQPVAQVVAGFAKVFVGEIVEKGAKLLTPCIGMNDCPFQFTEINHAYSQLGLYKNGAATLVPYHQITCERRTGCIN